MTLDMSTADNFTCARAQVLSVLLQVRANPRRKSSDEHFTHALARTLLSVLRLS